MPLSPGSPKFSDAVPSSKRANNTEWDCVLCNPCVCACETMNWLSSCGQSVTFCIQSQFSRENTALLRSSFPGIRAELSMNLSFFFNGKLLKLICTQE